MPTIRGQKPTWKKRLGDKEVYPDTADSGDTASVPEGLSWETVGTQRWSVASGNSSGMVCSEENGVPGRQQRTEL